MTRAKDTHGDALPGRPELGRDRRQPGGARARGPAWLRLLALAGLALALGPETATAAPPSDDAGEAQVSTRTARPISTGLSWFMERVDAWDLEGAKVALTALPPGPDHELAEGVLAVYEARYEDAEGVLAGVVASFATAAEDDPTANQARHYLEVARGAQLALGEALTLTSEDGRFEAVFADPKDALLAPYLFEAMASAYEQLGEDIGVRPKDPIRFEFYDEPGKLALVTPLTLDNIYTTGTVGICKYRRIMMVTPRVMFYGYGWLDTAIHEYVHYLLSMRTQNNAPVWMQEGMAKLMESRWRPDGRSELTPSVRALLSEALTNDTLVTLEQMHPSIAMLPSQEMAALAYAEAETMLGLLEEERGREGMADFMDQVALGVDAKAAFANTWGQEFERFFEHWRRTMATRTHARRGSTSAHRGVAFRESESESEDPESADPSLSGDVFSHLGGGAAHKHARLGVLLTLRGHPEAAVIEYEKARSADPSVRRDPKLARRLGELYLDLDQPARALPLLISAGEDDPEDANIAAAEGRARRLSGDDVGARAALSRAVRKNPFIPGLHCDLAALATIDGDEQTAAREAALCPD